MEHTPISFDASVLSTPKSTSPGVQVSPDLKPSARLNFEENVVEKEKEKGRKWGFGCDCWRLILGLSLVYVVVYGFYSNLVSGVLKPVLSPEVVRNAGEKSWVVQDLNGRLRFLQKEMQGLVPGTVSNCSYPNSIWEITQVLSNQKTPIFHSNVSPTHFGYKLEMHALISISD